MTINDKLELWDLINDYVVSCGGSPGVYINGNIKRKQIIEEIKDLLEKIEQSVKEKNHA